MGYYDEEDYVSVSYRDIVDGWEYQVLLEVSDSDYQGDSRFLLKDGYRVGFLQFGWGSCSGCDALQACDSKAEYDDLAARLKDSIQWFGSQVEALKFFNEHDWEADYSWHDEEQKQFIAQAKEMLAQ